MITPDLDNTNPRAPLPTKVATTFLSTKTHESEASLIKVRAMEMAESTLNAVN